MLRRATSNQIILSFLTNRCRSYSSEQSGSVKNWLLQMPACWYACKSHGQTSICYECSRQDWMRSQKIRSHHKSHERLATLATRPAMGDVQAMSTHIQISPRLCTRRNSAFRLHDRNRGAACDQLPSAISSSREQQHRSKTGPSHMLDHKHGIVFHHSSEPQKLCLCSNNC